MSQEPSVNPAAIEDLPRQAEELTPEQAEQADGGIIAILIGLNQPTKPITDGTSNTLMLGEHSGGANITDGTSNTLMFGEK